MIEQSFIPLARERKYPEAVASLLAMIEDHVAKQGTNVTKVKAESGHSQRTSRLRRRNPCRSAVTGTPAAEASAPAKAGLDNFHWDEVGPHRARLVPDGLDRWDWL